MLLVRALSPDFILLSTMVCLRSSGCTLMASVLIEHSRLHPIKTGHSCRPGAAIIQHIKKMCELSYIIFGTCLLLIGCRVYGDTQDRLGEAMHWVTAK